MSWPFSSHFMYIYELARKSDWRWKDKPVTIALLLGYYSGMFSNVCDNMFRPGSPAWSDFNAGKKAYILSEKDKYFLKEIN